MRILRRITLTVVLLAGLIYTSDYLSVRVRMAYNHAPFDAMEIQRLLAIRLKSGRYEMRLDEPEMQTCVRALFPHLGYVPCWYLARHTHQQVIYD